MSAGIARLRGLLDDAGRADESFTIGAIRAVRRRAPVGRRPGCPRLAPSRWPASSALAGLGVDQIEVAFRSRDVHELCDQVRLFGAEVAPLVV